MTASTRKPLLVVADDDQGQVERDRVIDELSRRYSGDYAVGGCSVAELETTLDRAYADGDDVAICLAVGERGAELLAGVRARFPAARRGLLIPWLGWADRALSGLVLRAMAHGWIDLYVLRPTRTPDEVFHLDDLGAFAGVGQDEGRGPGRCDRGGRPTLAARARAAVDARRTGNTASSRGACWRRPSISVLARRRHRSRRSDGCRARSSVRLPDRALR